MAQLISLESLRNSVSAPDMQQARTKAAAPTVALTARRGPVRSEEMRKALSSSSGCEWTSSCGTSDTKDDMAAEIWEKVKDHPCYSEEAHHYFARMHVRVAPPCTIRA